MKAYKLGTGLISGRPSPLVLVEERIYTLADVLRDDAPATLLDVFANWRRFDTAIGEGVEQLASGGADPTSIQYLTPIAFPPKVICIGVNYHDHLREMQVNGLPEFPYAFLRPHTSLAAHKEEIRLPHGVEMTDWEAELGVVIGETIGPDHRIDPMDAVAGYTVINDVSARDWIKKSPPMVGIDWVMQKARDKFQPTGPWVTPARFVPEPQQLAIELTVNGVVKQKSNTAEMIFGVRDIVAHLASILTLEPGDIIATGTPAGVGFGRKPPEFIKHSDEVRVTIEGLGTLENRFI